MRLTDELCVATPRARGPYFRGLGSISTDTDFRAKVLNHVRGGNCRIVGLIKCTDDDF